MAAIGPKYPLIQYLRLQNEWDSAIDAALQGALNDVETQLAALDGKMNISSQVGRAQLAAQKAALKSRISSLINGVGATTQDGRVAAVQAAIDTFNTYTDQLFDKKKWTDQGQVQALAASEAARAAAGYDTMLARLSSSQRALSKQVYDTGRLASGWIDNLVNQGLAAGWDWSRLAKEISGSINPNVPGGVAYAAKRLARTEINNAFHDGTLQRWQDSIVVDGMDWHLSQSHPEGDECDDLAANSPYAKGEIPQKPHPFCLCFLTPNVPSDEDFLNKLFAGEYDDSLPDYAKTGETEGTGAPKWSDISESKEFKIGLKSVYEGRSYSGFTLEGTDAWEQRGAVMMETRIISPDGKPAGIIARIFHQGSEGIYVSHELMELRPEFRGQGFSSEFSKFSETWYRENNFDHIEIHAALEDGGYAWARAGYVWDPHRYSQGSPPSDVYAQLKRLYEAPADQGFRDIGDANREVVKGFMDRFTGPVSGWPTPAELASSGAEPVVGSTDTLKTGKTGKLGKNIMRGSNWFGVKYLK